MDVNPLSLNLKGGTQPEIFQGRVDAIVQELTADATRFWRQSLAQNALIEIWEINGERWLYDGNHRYHAAIQAKVDIPSSNIKIVDKTGSTIPTWRFDQMTWLPGFN
jgi:hypothetical protein